MAQLHYATADSEIDLHLDDEHAYRFHPKAWRFAWLWWNLVLLVLVLVAVGAVMSVSTGPRGLDLTDWMLAKTLTSAPMVLAMSLLMAHRKLDLSYPMQTGAALSLFAWLTLNANLDDPGRLLSVVTTVVLLTLLVGVINWVLCSVVQTASAVTTLFVGGLVGTAASSVAGFSGFGSTPLVSHKSLVQITEWVTHWGPIALASAVACLTTAWLVLRRRLPSIREQRRNEAIAELAGFLLVSIIAALAAIWEAVSINQRTGSMGFAASVSWQETLLILACVIVGGTLFGGKLPNPVGALLATILFTAADSLAVNYLPVQRDFGLRVSYEEIAVAAACVVLVYSRRLRALLSAKAGSQVTVRPPSYLAIGAAALTLTLLIGLCLTIPVLAADPREDIRRGADPLLRLARYRLCLSFIAATATYLLLFAADLLMSWRIKAKA